MPKVFEEYCCGLTVKRFDKDGNPDEMCDYHFEDSNVPFIQYRNKHGGWENFEDSQIVKDMIEFNEYVKRTRYVERSFEENLFICIDQIGNLDGIQICSEDGKHCCVCKEVGYSGMCAYKIDVDGASFIIYDFDSNIREITMFSSTVMKQFFV